MLSEMQRRKLTRLFTVGYDQNRSGVMERSDFEAVAENVIYAFGVEKDSSQYKMFHAGILSLWDDIKKLCDKDGDAKVTLDEFLCAYDALLADESKFNQTIDGLIGGFKLLSDMDKDGKLSQREFASIGLVFNTPIPLTLRTFSMLDKDRDGYLTEPELRKAVEEFYYSNDPSAPGNFLFGPV